MIQTGVDILADGTKQPKYETVLTESNPETRLMNTAGARYVTRNLRKFYNPHVAMGNLVTNRECAVLAADTALSIFAHIEANSSIYECDESKFSMIEAEYDSTLRSLYLFLTALRDGKLLSFGRETTSANYSSNNAPIPKDGLSLPFGGK